MKKIVAVTGSNGILGKELCQCLENNHYKVLRLHHNISEAEEILREAEGDICALIHCAFARNNNLKELVAAIQFTKEIMLLAVRERITGIINISSKSVYENSKGNIWNEYSEIDPIDNYAYAKYASEMIADACVRNSEVKLMHLRLASLIGCGMEQRVVSKLVDKVIAKENITIQNGNQIYQYLDVKDAAEAIVRCLSQNIHNWKNVYCVGPESTLTLEEIAKRTVHRMECLGFPDGKLEICYSQEKQNGYMDTTMFHTDMEWREKYTLEETIDFLIEERTSRCVI